MQWSTVHRAYADESDYCCKVLFADISTRLHFFNVVFYLLSGVNWQ